MLRPPTQNLYLAASAAHASGSLTSRPITAGGRSRGAASDRTFVSNMLSGFLLEMGQVSWAARFAVFARYNLAGPFQTEAQCGGRLL
jgi:hypothetical protein